MTLTQLLIAEAESTYGVTEELFRRVTDDDLSWKPATGENWMTVGQLLFHCAAQGCGIAARGFVTGVWDFGGEADEEASHLPTAEEMPAVESVSQALEFLDADRQLTLTTFEGTGEATLMTREMAAPWGGRELPLFQHLLHMIEHLAQHKGQLFYYLKLMGRKVDTLDLWGL